MLGDITKWSLGVGIVLGDITKWSPGVGIVLCDVAKHALGVRMVLCVVTKHVNVSICIVFVHKTLQFDIIILVIAHARS